MKVAEGQWERLQFLARVTHKECLYLQETDGRLFADPISALKAGHAFVPVLVNTAQRFAEQIAKLTP